MRSAIQLSRSTRSKVIQLGGALRPPLVLSTTATKSTMMTTTFTPTHRSASSGVGRGEFLLVGQPQQQQQQRQQQVSPYIFGPKTAVRFFSASQNLSDLLSKELNEEMDSGNADLPDELRDLKADIEKDWKIVDDGAMTRLYRTVGSNKVTVSFHCQDAVEDPVDVDEYAEEEQQEEEEPSVPFRFVVTSTKAGKTVVFNCMSVDGTSSIESVAMTTDDTDTIQTNGGINSQQYQGPDFTELDHAVQEAFHAYLQEELGIKEDVNAFICMYGDYKEELEYVQFLKDTKAFLG